MGTIISVKNLVKNYGLIKAVKDVSFEVETGSLFAFLGPNGAGKSTTIDILSTLITKDAGEVVINGCQIGKDDQKIRSSIGVVFQTSVLDNLLTVKENLSVRGSFYELKGESLKERILEASAATGCDDFLNRKYGKLSGGQKRRADIARALINRPNILFLDEPTTGLDPQTRISVWKTIRKMQKDFRMTVFLTTHYMEEAANADKITIIDKGKVVASGSPIELKEKYTSDVLKIYNPSSYITQYLAQNNIIHTIEKDNIIIEINTSNKPIDILYDLKPYINSFEVIHGNMDDVFVNIISKSQEETIHEKVDL